MSIGIGGWVTYPQCHKLSLQGHVALDSHGLIARVRLTSTENVFIDKFSEEAANSVFVEIFEQ